jgi:tRNA(fMet)-specific endonuclease VapC
VSKRHADLIAWTRRAGVTRNPNDLIVAATAAATGRELLTLDRKAAFANLPGVIATDLGGR